MTPLFCLKSSDDDSGGNQTRSSGETDIHHIVPPISINRMTRFGLEYNKQQKNKQKLVTKDTPCIIWLYIKDTFAASRTPH